MLDGLADRRAAVITLVCFGVNGSRSWVRRAASHSRRSTRPRPTLRLAVEVLAKPGRLLCVAGQNQASG